MPFSVPEITLPPASAFVWMMGILAFMFGILVEAWPQIKHRVAKLRLERRLARSDYILADEYREHEIAIGKEPEEARWGKALLQSSVLGLYFFMLFWIQSFERSAYWLFALIAVQFVCQWSWNFFFPPDPLQVDSEGYSGPPSAQIPSEAKWGLIGGIAMVGLILAFISVM